jgi:hypothetical protein
MKGSVHAANQAFYERRVWRHRIWPDCGCSDADWRRSVGCRDHPPVVASTQIGINPLEMMANAGDLPTPHYDYYDTVFSSDHVASLFESPKKKQRRVNKSYRFPSD